MGYVYRHLERDEHIGEEGNRYSASEFVIEYGGRKVLYQYVDATTVSFCTASGVPYAGSIHVKGYVLKWKYGTDQTGAVISDIEPVVSDEDRKALRAMLWPGPGSHRVTFLDHAGRQ